MAEIKPLPDKKYQIIYADPPWDYGNTKNPKGWWGRTEKHYESLSLKDLQSINLQSISDENCYLFLWVTSPFLEKAFDLIKSWGFKYATIGFVWIKTKNNSNEVRGDGLGKYTLSNAEYCLICRKGKYWRNSKKVKQIILHPKAAHSKKPDEIRNRIVNLCGDIPRIELFAREKFDGWDAWGNEIS